MAIPARLLLSINGKLHQLANYCAFSFFLVILVPQSTFICRPGLILATFCMWFFCSLDYRMVETIKRVGPLAILPLLQLLITFVKMRLSGGTMAMHMTFLAGPIYLSLVTFLCGHYLIHDARALLRIRIWSIIILGVVIAYAIPTIFAEPGVGRFLAMHRDHLLQLGINPDRLTIRGVPGYAIVYTIAMISLLLFSWVKDARAISRTVHVLYVAAMAILFFHILYSMFTLATIAGELIFFTGMTCFILLSRMRYRFARILLMAVVLLATSQTESMQYVNNKSSRLVSGMASQGIEKGDETGRGTRMMRSFHTFLEHPLLGCEFDDEVLKEKIGDHSSLVDPLGMFGIIGYLPMIVYQFILVFNGLRTWNANRKDLRGIGELGAWVFFGVCTFWNTTTYTVLPFALLFLQFMPLSKNELAATNGSISGLNTGRPLQKKPH